MSSSKLKKLIDSYISYLEVVQKLVNHKNLCKVDECYTCGMIETKYMFSKKKKDKKMKNFKKSKTRYVDFKERCMRRLLKSSLRFENRKIKKCEYYSMKKLIFKKKAQYINDKVITIIQNIEKFRKMKIKIIDIINDFCSNNKIYY